ncbi:hypothetical protein GGS20DRAFT_408807 [Poronia punctata]|nr:hypothetical protein GGS20DRAFT_408807 [Poronia punctata]
MDGSAVRETDNVNTTDFPLSSLMQDNMAGSVSPQPSPHINLPPPNPPFSFPSLPSSSAPSLASRTRGRRHQSAIDIPRQLDALESDPMGPRRQSAALPDFSFNPGSTLSPESASRRPRPPPLPDFSFNPGVSSTDTSLLSPAQTPTSPRTVPSHIGHRRGGSEFVGGKLTTGESITVMSTSPTKAESGFASPTLAPSSGPRKHQRGHSHRRSGAISSHDLSLLLQASPSPSSKGNSAPGSPADFRESHGVVDRIQKTVEAATPHSNETGKSDPKPLAEKSSQASEPSPRPVTRARVGFSDTLEFIPRPLSLVSTDTASTVRPGHSVSGSISSIASITNSTTTDRDPHSALVSPTPRSKSDSRPRTAGAVLERTPSLRLAPTEDNQSVKRRNSIPVLNDVAQANASPPPAMTTPTKTPKRWSFFGQSFATTGSPTKARPGSPGSSEPTMRDGSDNAPSYDNENTNSPEVDTAEPVSPVVEKKKSSKKRQKRVKTWAGSILTRKSKSRKSKSRRRSQTPPTSRLATEEQEEDFDFSAPGNPSFKIDFQTDPSHSAPELQVTKRRSARTDDDVSYPMIDLDAALGPFNTPTRDPQWDEAQRAGAPPKRQLHSAAGMRGFSGPGMHYHRRAESAPEMPPFEAGRFNIHRFGSSSTMADVFEEDEEEDSNTGESATEDSGNESQGTTTGDEAEDDNDMDDANSTPTQEHSVDLLSSQIEAMKGSSSKRKQSGSSLDLPPPGMIRNETSSSSLHNEIILEEETSSFPARRDVMFVSPSETSGSGGLPHRREGDKKEPTPPDATSIILSGSPAMPISPYPISQSSFPSPRSPMSYDTHRISTAPSSVTDENNFRSLLMGEPGPEVIRLSVDVPSLTSTNSTMTRESSFIPGVRPRGMPFHEQRPASFTSTAFGRRRSSLVSLGRFINSAHGERSKLSMEVPFNNEAEKKNKPSKSKRLSRMMQFWKPKPSNDS